MLAQYSFQPSVAKIACQQNRKQIPLIMKASDKNSKSIEEKLIPTNCTDYS